MVLASTGGRLKVTAAIPGLQPDEKASRKRRGRAAVTRPGEISNAFVSPADSK